MDIKDAGSKKPKLPRLMKDVYAQILGHPDYKTKCSESTRWCFENAVIAGKYSSKRENKKWAKDIWKHLHWQSNKEFMDDSE
jgi:hypothetical protein